ACPSHSSRRRDLHHRRIDESGRPDRPARPIRGASPAGPWIEWEPGPGDRVARHELVNATELRPVGETGLKVSRLGLGTGPLRNPSAAVRDADAHAVVQRCLDKGIAYFDTAPVYGMGLAETRLGAVLAVAGSTVVVSTKVGRLLREDAPASADMFHEGEP